MLQIFLCANLFQQFQIFVSNFLLQIPGQAQFLKVEKNIKDFGISVELMKNESKKLLERAALAEDDMKKGHAKLK